MNSALDNVTKAKPEAFLASETDFWKPGLPGTPEAILQGIYLGYSKIGRSLQHAFAVKSKRDGKPMVMRCNGTHGLTRELLKLSPRDGVRVEFKGKTGTLGGNTYANWDVRKLNT